MAQHYLIGISVVHPIEDTVRHFRLDYQLNEKYKVLPHASDLHITMRYIGELDEAKLSWLKSSLHKIARSHTHFTVYVKGLSSIKKWELRTY